MDSPGISHPRGPGYRGSSCLFLLAPAGTAEPKRHAPAPRAQGSSPAARLAPRSTPRFPDLRYSASGQLPQGQGSAGSRAACASRCLYDRTALSWLVQERRPAKAALNPLRSALSHLLDDAVLVLAQGTGADEDFGAEEKQPSLAVRAKGVREREGAAGHEASLLLHVDHLLHGFKGAWNWIQP